MTSDRLRHLAGNNSTGKHEVNSIWWLEIPSVHPSVSCYCIAHVRISPCWRCCWNLYSQWQLNSSAADRWQTADYHIKESDRWSGPA